MIRFILRILTLYKQVDYLELIQDNLTNILSKLVFLIIQIMFNL